MPENQLGQLPLSKGIGACPAELRGDFLKEELLMNSLILPTAGLPAYGRTSPFKKL